MAHYPVCPILPVQAEIWQNGHGNLAAMAEHPIFLQQNMVSDLPPNPVGLQTDVARAMIVRDSPNLSVDSLPDGRPWSLSTFCSFIGRK